MRDRLHDLPSRGVVDLASPEARKLSGIQPLSRRLFPEGIELLQRFPGFDRFYKKLRADLIMDPEKRTWAVVFWGPTGSGKRTAISQFFYLLENDPLLPGRDLKKWYVSFAESANAMQIEGKMNAAGHGRYKVSEYRLSSQRMSGFVWETLNNYEGKKVLAVEASSPTAYLTPEGIQGPDRGYSVVRMLAETYRQRTRVVAVRRDKELMESILEFREAIFNGTDDDVVTALKNAHISLYHGKVTEDVDKMSKWNRHLLRKELMETGAPPVGILRSADEMRQRMQDLHDQGIIPSPDDEKSFWTWLLKEDLGLDESQYIVTMNKFTQDKVSLHERLLVGNDWARRHNFIVRHQMDFANITPSLPVGSRLAIKYEMERYKDFLQHGLWERVKGWFPGSIL